MIVNFYKVKQDDYRHAELLVSKNIEHLPDSNMYVAYKGQCFKIVRIYFNIDDCEYHVYLIRL